MEDRPARKEGKQSQTFKLSTETKNRLETLAECLTSELGFKVSRSAAVEFAVKEALDRREVCA